MRGTQRPADPEPECPECGSECHRLDDCPDYVPDEAEWAARYGGEL